MRYGLLFFFLLLTGHLSANERIIDSLKKVIATAPTDSLRLEEKLKLARFYEQSGDFANGITEAESVALQARKLKIYSIEADALNRIGCMTLSQGSYQKSLGYLAQSMNLYRQLNQPDGVGGCLVNSGLAYRKLGDIPHALNCYFQALKALEKGTNKKFYANALTNIGVIYYEQKKYADAIQYYERAFTVHQEIKNQRGIVSVFVNLGNVYLNQQAFTKAEESYLKALEMAQKEGLKKSISDIYCNLGDIFMAEKKYTKSLEYQLKSLYLEYEMGDTTGLIISLSCVANVYQKMGKYAQSRDSLRKSFNLARKVGFLEFMKENMKLMARADSALGDYRSAYEHYKLYTQYKDSLFNEDKAKEFGRVESRYQFEKEAEDQKRKAEEARIKAQAETDRRNSLQYLLIFSGIIGLFATVMVLGRFRISSRLMDVALFTGLLILFEFCLILFDPVLDQFTGGIPIQKLAFNSLIALAFAPLHRFLERGMRKRMGKTLK